MSRILGKGYKITCYPIGNNLVTNLKKKKKKCEPGGNMLKFDKTINWNILRTQKFKNIKTLNY
jgi:hypothetical protein